MTGRKGTPGGFGEEGCGERRSMAKSARVQCCGDQRVLLVGKVCTGIKKVCLKEFWTASKVLHHATITLPSL
ncbi:hypothetical protein ACWGEU_08255 [Streptomyces goshikiensis]